MKSPPNVLIVVLTARARFTRAFHATTHSKKKGSFPCAAMP